MKDPKDTNPTGGKGKGKEEERLTSMRSYQSLNLLLNDQTFENKTPSLHSKIFLEQGKKFGALRQSKSQ
jgi:hypothetical protein